MSMIRYRQDILYELNGIRAKIASNRRSAQNVTKPSSAKILDAVYPSLVAAETALINELALATDRPERAGYQTAAKIEFAKVFDMDAEGFDIPEFLQRRR